VKETHPLTQAVIAGRRKNIPELVHHCLAAEDKALALIKP
jgi:hypothetical protein